MLRVNRLQKIPLFLLLVVLPFQFGKHFWPFFAYVGGQRVDYLSPTLYISDVVILLLLIAAASAFFLQAWKQKFSILALATKKPMLLFFVGLLFLSVGIFFSASPLSGWYALGKLLEFIFFGWLIARQTKAIGPILFWALSLGVILEGSLGVLQFFRQGSLGGLWYYLGERSFTASTPGIANASIHGQLILRPYATFPHPNVFAGYIVIALLFFLTRIISSKSKMQQILSGIVLVFGFFILLLTLSRVALIVFFLTSLFFVFMRFSRFKNQIMAFAVVVIVGILASSPLLSDRILDPSSYRESFVLRDILMQSALRMAVSHPIFGIGLGNFLPLLPHYMTTKVLFGFLQPVHSIFLLILAETGIIGLGGFLWVLYQAFDNVLASLKKGENQLAQFAFLSLICIVGIGMTDHYFLTLQQGQLLFALILGLCFADFSGSPS